MSAVILSIVLLMTVTVPEAGATRLRDRMKILEGKMTTLNDVISTQNQDITTLNSEISTLTGKMATCENEMASLTSRMSSAVTTDTSGKIPLSALPNIPQSLLPSNTVHTDDTGRLAQDILPDSLVYKDDTGRLAQDILPDSLVYKDDTGRLAQDILPDSLVYKDGTGIITQDILPDSLVYKDDTGRLAQDILPDSLVYKDGTGRITQDILPGSYASYTVEDLLWKSQHMAAVAACNKFGSRWGVVIPVTTGSTCSDTCWSGTSCSGIVLVQSEMGKSTTYRSHVGYWDKRYSCSSTGHSSEVSKNEGYILGYNTLHYCCCTR